MVNLALRGRVRSSLWVSLKIKTSNTWKNSSRLNKLEYEAERSKEKLDLGSEVQNFASSVAEDWMKGME